MGLFLDRGIECRGAAWPFVPTRYCLLILLVLSGRGLGGVFDDRILSVSYGSQGKL